MDFLDRRAVGFQQRFALQEEFRSRVRARRNRAVGLWAASLMGLDAADAEALADVLVEEDPDDDAIAKALVVEFVRANVDMSQRRVRAGNWWRPLRAPRLISRTGDSRSIGGAKTRRFCKGRVKRDNVYIVIGQSSISNAAPARLERIPFRPLSWP